MDVMCNIEKAVDGNSIEVAPALAGPRIGVVR